MNAGAEPKCLREVSRRSPPLTKARNTRKMGPKIEELDPEEVPDLEEDTLMEKDDAWEEQAAASGVDLDDSAARRKFAAEQYESALKETEAQGEARRKSVADAVALLPRPWRRPMRRMY